MKKFAYEYAMAGNAATTLIVRPGEVRGTFELLLGRRIDTSDAEPGEWVFPGGFLNAGKERMIGVAIREDFEEVGVQLTEDQLTLFYVDDIPGTDGRFSQVVNLCYWVLLPDREFQAVPGDDIQECRWVEVEALMDMIQTKTGEITRLGFSHNDIFTVLYNKELGEV